MRHLVKINQFGVAKLVAQSQSSSVGLGITTIAVTYDASGNISARTDVNGTQTTYTLPRNLEVRQVEFSGAPQARAVSTAWHPNYRLPIRIAEFPRLESNFHQHRIPLRKSQSKSHFSIVYNPSSKSVKVTGFDARTLAVHHFRIWHLGCGQ